MERLTVEVVDPEEEDQLFVAALPGELVHCVNKLGHGDGAVTVAVEDSEGPFDEKRLQR